MLRSCSRRRHRRLLGGAFRRQQQQLDAEGAALAKFALHTNFTIMHVDDRLADVQSQPNAPVVEIDIAGGAEEAVKNVWLIRGGDAHTPVDDVETRFAPLFLQLQPDDIFISGISQRIAQQIIDCPA